MFSTASASICRIFRIGARIPSLLCEAAPASLPYSQSTAIIGFYLYLMSPADWGL